MTQAESKSPVDLIEMDAPFDEAAPRFALSIHKCGSTLLVNLIEGALAALDRPWVNIPRQMYTNGVVRDRWATDSTFAKLIRPGYVYTGFRERPQFVNDEDMAAARSVLLVRDPRDALVSAYFSFGPKGSHDTIQRNPAAARRALARRRQDAALTIDEWVLKRAPRFHGQFMSYRPFVGLETMAVYRYENVFFDKTAFLRSAFEHLGLPFDEVAFQPVLEKYDIVPEKENPKVHIRKGLPGDHIEKLKPDTIAQLDEIFADVYELYGYR